MRKSLPKSLRNKLPFTIATNNSYFTWMCIHTLKKSRNIIFFFCFLPNSLVLRALSVPIRDLKCIVAHVNDHFTARPFRSAFNSIFFFVFGQHLRPEILAIFRPMLNHATSRRETLSLNAESER